MLNRKKSPKKIERDWFMFCSGLNLHLCHDYMALRLLYALEPYTTTFAILPKMVEVTEKSIKFFLFVQKKSEFTLSEARSKYGHNIEKMRAESVYYERVFDDDDVKELTKDLNDVGGEFYQYLRYGSQETTNGSSAEFNKIIQTVDKIFFSSILLIPEQDRKNFNYVSPLKNFLTRSLFDQSRNPEILLAALKVNNIHINGYIEYCEKIDKEYMQLMEHLNNLSQSA